MTMKKTILRPCLLLFAVSILLIACNRDKCPPGFICQDNTCVCPEGKFQANGQCRDLRPNEYYADLSACTCRDSIFFEILERTDGLLRIQFDLGWGFSQVVCGLIPMPGGDSLYTEEHSTFYNGLACPIDGRLTGTQIFGRFTDNDSKINVTLKYMAYPDFEKEMGRCSFVLHQ